LSLKYDNYKLIKLITVYFPCFEASPAYLNELDKCVGFIESVVNVGDEAIILGDFNFRCDESHSGFRYCRTAFNQLGIFNCDDLCHGSDGFTYFNNSLGQGSFIDHVFVTNSLRSHIESIFIIDSGANLSDHRPIIATFKLCGLVSTVPNDTQRAHSLTAYTSRAWRWDKANLASYYESTRLTLADIKPPRVCLTCNPECRSQSHCYLI
jgi:hypothetical protein